MSDHTETAAPHDALGHLPADRGADRFPAREPARYELRGEHARGGIGRILAAHDRDLDRTIAVKELLSASSSANDRFYREARITARLEHPSIVPVHDIGCWPDGTPFYSMKMIGGQPLGAAIAGCGSFEARVRLLPRVLAVAEAVAYAHSCGVVHRDLKPSNVMAGAFGETVVLDWGLAKDLDDTTDEATIAAGPYRAPAEDGLTIDGTILGTPAYMPPEQARGEPVDARADVYSLGAILYHLLTGSCPYVGESSSDTLSQVLAAPPADVQAAEPRVPTELAAIVRRAMDRSPAGRYADAGEFVEDLTRFQAGKLVGAHRYSASELLLRWLGRHKFWLIPAVLALVAVGTMAGLSVQRVVAARDSAEDRTNELILLQASSHLKDDPTRSIAWLKSYPNPGKHWETVRDIAADAVSRGVAYRVLPGHDAALWHLEFLPGDKQLIAKAHNNTIRKWDVEAGTSEVVASDASRYGKFDVSEDGTLLAYQQAGGDVVARRLEGEYPIVRTVKLTAKGARSVSVSASTLYVEPAVGAVTLLVPLPDGPTTELAGWGTRVNARSTHLFYMNMFGLHVRTISSNAEVVWAPTTLDPIREVDFSGEGSAVAIRDTNAIAHWDLGRDAYRVLRSEPATFIRISSDGRRVAAAFADKLVRVYSSDGELLSELPFSGEVSVLSFSPDGQLLAVAGARGAVVLFNIGSGARQAYPGHKSVIARLLFSRDGKWLVSGGVEGDLRVWPVPHSWPTVLRGHEGYVYQVEFSPDGSRLVTGSQDGTVRLWDPASGTHQLLGKHKGFSWGVRYAPDGSSVASVGLHDGKVRLWPVDGSAPVTIATHARGATSVAFSPDASWIASTGNDGAVTVWSRIANSGREIGRHTNACAPVVFSASGELLASAGHDDVVKLWSLAGAELQVFRHEDAVLDLAFLPDEAGLVTAGADGQVLLWSIRDGGRQQLVKHDGAIEAVAISADGAWVASTAADGVCVTSIATGARTWLRGHQDYSAALAFSPDSRWLLSGSQDATARVWNLQSGEVRVLRGHDDRPVRGVAFSPDGRTVATASWDGTARVWDVKQSEMVPLPTRKLRAWMDKLTSFSSTAEVIAH